MATRKYRIKVRQSSNNLEVYGEAVSILKKAVNGWDICIEIKENPKKGSFRPSTGYYFYTNGIIEIQDNPDCMQNFKSWWMSISKHVALRPIKISEC